MKRVFVLAAAGLVLGFVVSLVGVWLHLEGVVAGLQFLVAAFLAAAAGSIIQQRHGEPAVNVYLAMGGMIGLFTVTFAYGAMPLVSMATGFHPDTRTLLYLAVGLVTASGLAGTFVANRNAVGSRIGQFLLVSVVGASLGVGVLTGLHLEVLYFIGDFVSAHSTLGPAVHFSLITAMLAGAVGVFLRQATDRG